MEVKKADFISYGFTVKDNRQDVTDYKSFFDNVKNNGCKVTCSYNEYDSANRLHVHGIIQIPKGFYRKRLCLQGLHIKLEELYDPEGWIRYIRKDQKVLQEEEGPLGEDPRVSPSDSD